MSFRLELSHNAARYYRRLSEPTLTAVSRRLRQLQADPYEVPLSKPLQGPGMRRASRVGSLRIIYTVDQAAGVIRISAIGPRGQVYRDL